MVELKEAREAQSPQGKLLSSLQRKIAGLELKQQHREQELQQVLIRCRGAATSFCHYRHTNAFSLLKKSPRVRIYSSVCKMAATFSANKPIKIWSTFDLSCQTIVQKMQSFQRLTVVVSPRQSPQPGELHPAHLASRPSCIRPGDRGLPARAGHWPAAIRGGAVEAPGPGEEQGAGRLPPGAGLHSGRPQTPAECRLERGCGRTAPLNY